MMIRYLMCIITYRKNNLKKKVKGKNIITSSFNNQ